MVNVAEPFPGERRLNVNQVSGEPDPMVCVRSLARLTHLSSVRIGNPGFVAKLPIRLGGDASCAARGLHVRRGL
jgi:hypothetical protein